MSIPLSPVASCAAQHAEQPSPRPTQRRTINAEGGNAWTPRHYAQSIWGFAHSTGLFNGEDYTNLAIFLSRTSGPRYELAAGCGSSQQPLSRPPVLYKWTEISDTRRCILHKIDDLVHIDPQSIEDQSGAMIILSGFQPPEWLNAVGSRFRLDPAILQEHLEFKAYFGRRMLYTSPSLPSISEGLIRLRYFTIGIRKYNAQSNDVSTLRRQAIDEMDQYLGSLHEERDVEPGDTFARRYYVHSPKIFSIEQQITVGVQRSAGGGWSGVTWIDSGNDRENGLIGPWRERNTARSGLEGLLPIVMRAPKIALNWQHRNMAAEEHRDQTQSRCHLYENYGSSLDPRIMANEPFYAITELMQFAASSICQLLNMIDSTISRATLATAVVANNYDISELSYHQQLLDDVARTLRENLRVIGQRGSATWPRAKDQKQRAKADRTAASLLADYQELDHRNQDLIKKCHNHMKTIINQASVAETQRSLAQARKVTQLTWLAFMFVPLTFTTSFLGMNVSVFGQGTAPLWLWFAITAPLMLVAFVLLVLGNRVSTQSAGGFKRRRSLREVWDRGASV
ncbi:hypothetical protein CKM354_001212600 [Cercospora kikuchii]|uniref:Uncharacterized protein n=1 Tax=Cercospora kikuchii TaxID=84275 RepID=A0A9P3CV21_9PEZI|nr:uncharacterized protein CKM354_001212600 [Cercospora kikuchii]GIZ49086.1 hypothetical protein CKM354_001212600 [Cercospora kikuchii]